MNVNEVFKLVHEGRAPSAGEDDGRYILSGRGKLADVRVWPGLRIDRKWWVPSSDGTNQIEIPVENWVERERVVLSFSARPFFLTDPSWGHLVIARSPPLWRIC